MVKGLHRKKAIPLNGQASHTEPRAREFGVAGELWKPFLLSALAHVAALAGLIFVAPFFATPRLTAPPAQMVQLVDLPGGGAPGVGQPPREAPSAPAKKPELPPELPKPVPPQPPKAEPPKAEKPPEVKAEPRAEKAPPPKPKPAEPEMTLPAPKAKEPPKREEKKPQPSERQTAERRAEQKKEAEPPHRPEPPARPQPTPAPAAGGRGGAGPGGGLALGTGSGMLSLDAANFPFTYYLRQVTGRIEENWVRPQGHLGRVIVYFRIKRDGSIVEPQVYESSRNQTVDMLAAGAIKRSEPFPPLPVEFAGDYLGIYLCFGMGSACPGQKEG
jgi:outer membrane biosynthesis protein TonB